MKIVREDQNLLVIKENNLLVYFICSSFIFVGLLMLIKPESFTSNVKPMYPYICLLIGLITALLVSRTVITMDKISNKITIVNKSMIYKKLKEYMLSEVGSVEIQTGFIGGRSTRGGYSYSLALVFKDKTEVLLNPGSTGVVRFMGRQIVTERTVGQRVANFLGVLFEERRPPTVTETLSLLQKTMQDEIDKAKTMNPS